MQWYVLICWHVILTFTEQTRTAADGQYGNVSTNSTICPIDEYCWQKIYCCGENDPVVDDLNYEYGSQVLATAFWNSTLFVIGYTGIHYTHLEVEFIKYELTEASQNPSSLIKIIFNHSCRGDAIYDTDEDVRNVTKMGLNDEETPEISRGKNGTDETSEDCNWAMIWANVKGRTVSDIGYFTKWICYLFEGNITTTCNSIWKANFRKLITDIRINLEQETKGSHVCAINETIRHQEIRLDKCKIVENKNIDVSPKTNGKSRKIYKYGSFGGTQKLLRVES
eukprot:90428_1